MVAVHALVPAADVWRLLPRARGGGRVVDPDRARRADDRVSDRRATIKERGLDAVREWALEARRRRAGAREPRRRRCCRARRCSTLADRVRRWHAAQRPADVTLEVEPGVVLERRWVPLDTVGVYVPRNLVSTLVMCAVPAQAAGVRADRRLHAARTAPGLIAAAAELLGIDEVWALGGPQAIGWLAYVERVDKIVGPGQRVRERGEARGLARRADRPAGRAVGGGRARRRRPAARRARARRAARARARRGLHAPSTRSRRPRRIAPEHLVLLGEAEARADAGAQRRRGLRRPVVAGRGGRLRDRRQPRAADGRLGALGRRARARDVPEAGDGAAADARGARAASARRSRRSPRPRACPRTRRRCGDESARARVPRRTPGRRRPTRSRGSPASTRRRSCASTRTRRRCRCRSTRPGAIAGALAGVNGYPRRRLPRAARARSPTTTASSPRTSCSAPAPTT